MINVQAKLLQIVSQPSVICFTTIVRLAAMVGTVQTSQMIWGQVRLRVQESN